MTRTEQQIEVLLNETKLSDDGTIDYLRRVRSYCVELYETAGKDKSARKSEIAMYRTDLLCQIKAIDNAIDAVRLMGAL